MIKTVIYSRVSSESERQDTERQTKELQQYAKRMNYEVVEVFEEKVSGFKKNDQRPVFSKMLELAKEGSIDKILVWELSRIGRSVLQSLQNIQLLHDLKVGLYIKHTFLLDSNILNLMQKRFEDIPKPLLLLYLVVSSFYFNSFNNVLAASLPNSLEAKGLAPVISFLSTQTVLSDSVLTTVAPKFFNLSLTPFFMCPGK